MNASRRSVLAGAMGLAAGEAGAASRRRAPKDFLWGTAISGHQSEGNNVNSDSWVRENVTPTLFKERSGDACDSYHRFGEDFAIAARLGFNCQRFGVEWSRIEPNDGIFSNAELDHYARVLEACRARGMKAMVTFNHFTTPIWFARQGGFEVADGAERFAHFCRRTFEHLGGLINMATTFNEANIQGLVSLLPSSPSSRAATKAMMAAAAQATGAPRFSSLAFADPAISTPILQDAHRKAYAAMKAARPDVPVGLTLTTQDLQGPGAALGRERLYGDWVDVAKTAADFVGVQPYTRFTVDDSGMIASPTAGAEMTDAGYEFYPEALGASVRWAHETIGKPIYVTENGIATTDDTRRIAYIDRALKSLRACLDDGIPVHAYLHWSLLDNFEWTSGYSKRFGLVSVDRATFQRTPKPSAFHLGAIARAGLV